MHTGSDQLSHHESLLERLNQLSVSRSFIPQVHIDWNATTTDAEYESLYSSWSLLEGTGLDSSLDAQGRATFVKYQQMNLMTFTGLVERYGITALTKLYDINNSPIFSEYVGHFIKEETYHSTMFMKAAQKIQSGMLGSKPLPTQRARLTLRWMFLLLNALPSKKLRITITFTFFRFAEQVTLYAHQMVQSKIPRSDSLINQVWAHHALDEPRHLAFDTMILERNRLWWGWAWISQLSAALCCLLASLLLNANEIWISQQLGVHVGLWQLPGLMRRTKAPFKRRVFGLLRKTIVRRDTDGDKESNL